MGLGGTISHVYCTARGTQLPWAYIAPPRAQMSSCICSRSQEHGSGPQTPEGHSVHGGSSHFTEPQAGQQWAMGRATCDCQGPLPGWGHARVEAEKKKSRTELCTHMVCCLAGLGCECGRPLANSLSTCSCRSGRGNRACVRFCVPGTAPQHQQVRTLPTFCIPWHPSAYHPAGTHRSLGWSGHRLEV